MEPVDQIRTIYKTLFRVKFVHQSYTGLHGDFISNSLAVKPDKETTQLFKNHKILYRFNNDTLVCSMSCDTLAPGVPGNDPKNIPHINFTEDDIRIRFLINVSTAFLKKTIINVGGSQKTFQFSNQLNAGTNMVITSNADAVNDSDLKELNMEPGERSMAVIDIHTGNIADPAYQMFDANRLLVGNPPEYKIIFKHLI
jgi:hypothetical protein